MRDYEIVYIFRSSLTPEEIEAKLERYHAIITENDQGEITAVVQWGKRQLAYPIQKQPNGHYVIAQFTSSPQPLTELERVLKLEDDLLRYLVVISEGEMPLPAESIHPQRGPEGGGDRVRPGEKEAAPAEAVTEAADAAETTEEAADAAEMAEEAADAVETVEEAPDAVETAEEAADAAETAEEAADAVGTVEEAPDAVETAAENAGDGGEVAEDAPEDPDAADAAPEDADVREAVEEEAADREDGETAEDDVAEDAHEEDADEREE